MAKICIAVYEKVLHDALKLNKVVKLCATLFIIYFRRISRIFSGVWWIMKLCVAVLMAVKLTANFPTRFHCFKWKKTFQFHIEAQKFIDDVLCSSRFLPKVPSCGEDLWRKILWLAQPSVKLWCHSWRSLFLPTNIATSFSNLSLSSFFLQSSFACFDFHVPKRFRESWQLFEDFFIFF